MESLDEAIIREVEKKRREGIIGLRTPDTNIAMSHPDFAYILSGNFTLLENSDLSGMSINGEPLILEDKSPHDVLIIKYMLTELDQLAHCEGKERFRAKHAIRRLESLVRNFGDGRTDYYTTSKPIYLPNGAAVYFHDGPKGIRGFFRDLSLAMKYQATGWRDRDEYIISSEADFLRSHKHYTRHRTIARDAGARLTSMLIGLPADDSRLDKVTDARQLNSGILSIPLDKDSYERITNQERIELDDLGIGSQELRPNHLFHLSSQDSETVFRYSFREGISPLKVYDEFETFLDKLSRQGAHPATRKKRDLNSEISTETLEQSVRQLADEGLLDRNLEKAYIAQIEQAKGKLEEFDIKETARERRYTGSLRKVRKRLIKQLQGKATDPLAKTQGITGLPDIYLHRPFHPRGTQPGVIDTMLDQDVYLTAINASGGYGKTVLSFLVGLYHLSAGTHQKIHYFCSQGMAEKDYGTVGGSKDKKIAGSVNQVGDVFQFLFGLKGNEYIRQLQSQNRLELDVISDLRGRTLSDAYIIFDEFHLYDAKHAAFCIQRHGENSRVVVLSALEQAGTSIDSHVQQGDEGILHMAENSLDLNKIAFYSVPSAETYRGEHELQVLAQRMYSSAYRFARKGGRR
jgi:predicted ribonuclease YlaK